MHLFGVSLFALNVRSGANPNLRAFQLLLGHTKIESTVRYLGIEVDDALELEHIKIDVL
jgi:hypothetical protein